MNMTLSIDDRLLRRVRHLARARGTSVQALVRRYLESLTGARPNEEIAREYVRMVKAEGGHGRGYRFRREDAYEGRL